MPLPDPPADDLLTRVAELRAAGRSWAAVAEAVGKSARTIERWPAAYPYRWAVATAAAHEALTADARAESLTALRHQLRSDEDAVRSKAADLLLRHTGPKRAARRRRKPDARPTLSPELYAIALELEGKSDAELDQMLAELDAQEAADAPRPAGTAVH